MLNPEEQYAIAKQNKSIKNSKRKTNIILCVYKSIRDPGGLRKGFSLSLQIFS